MHKDRYPERIVCLTEETTETLYLLGEQDRIVGISGFTVRPPQARKEKPKIATFTDARIDEIIALKPDLVIGFSDMQAAIAKALIKKGVTVWINNHRSIEGIMDMMVQLGTWVGQRTKALKQVEDIQAEMERVKAIVARWPVRPKVYFEEWPDPLIVAIRWVSELIEIAGGTHLFAEKSVEPLAKNRILRDAQEVVAKNPDIVLASWCGKAFKKDRMLARQGWHAISAVKSDTIYAVDSSVMLQPGPAALTQGLQTLFGIFEKWITKYG